MATSTTSSATGGYLTPSTPYPLEDVDLDALLQSVVVGITGLPGYYVRPRWQVTVPKMPEPDQNWCAIGVMSIAPDDGAWIGYDPQNDVGPYVRHETINVVATFYGPNSGQFSGILRDGLAIPQNTDALRAVDMAWIECGPSRQAAEMFNEQWIKRQDVAIVFRRKVSRSYKITYIAIVAVDLTDDEVKPLNETIVVPPDSLLEP